MSYIKEVRQRVGHIPLIMTSASGVLFNDKGEILLQERADTGDWGFPGGYMEYGESFAQCVRREFLEDAGIAINPVELLGILDQDFYTYPNGDAVQPVNAVYLVKAGAGPVRPPKPSETVTTRYFPLDQPPRFFNGQHQKMWQLACRYAKAHQ